MLTCTQCGKENQLGRVFCSECGAKLDLTNMTSETVAESQQQSWFKRHWPKIAIGVGAFILILVVLGMWPIAGLLGEAGNKTKADEVRRLVAVELPRATGGRTRKKAFTEAYINAYFKIHKPSKALGATVSVKFQPRGIQLRVIKTLKTVDLKFVTWKPTVSYQALCIPVAQGLRMKKVKLGHLSVIGPMKGAVVKKIVRIFAAQKEWEALKHITKLEYDPSKLVLTVYYEKR